jgi:hypothetical protein
MKKIIIRVATLFCLTALFTKAIAVTNTPTVKCDDHNKITVKLEAEKIVNDKTNKKQLESIRGLYTQLFNACEAKPSSALT